MTTPAMNLQDYLSQAMGQILSGLSSFDPQGNHLVGPPDRVEFDVAVVPDASGLSVATGADPVAGVAAPGLSRVRFTVPLRPARPDFGRPATATPARQAVKPSR